MLVRRQTGGGGAARRRCTVSKPGTEFYKSKMTADGLQSYCKHCYKLTSAQTRVKKLQDEQAARDGAASPLAPEDQQVDVEDIRCARARARRAPRGRGGAGFGS